MKNKNKYMYLIILLAIALSVFLSSVPAFGQAQYFEADVMTRRSGMLENMLYTDSGLTLQRLSGAPYLLFIDSATLDTTGFRNNAGVFEFTDDGTVWFDIKMTIAGIPIQGNAVNNAILKIDISGSDTTFNFESDQTGGGGAGDIDEVTAGDGLTGGGTSGPVTLDVVGGTGITANADDIEVDETWLAIVIDSSDVAYADTTRGFKVGDTYFSDEGFGMWHPDDDWLSVGTGLGYKIFKEIPDQAWTIPDDSVTLAKLNQNGATDGQIYSWDAGIGGWVVGDPSGGGSALSVEGNDVEIDEAVITIDFSSIFTLTESPAHEINVTISNANDNDITNLDSLDVDKIVATEQMRADCDFHAEGNIYINKDSTDADAVLYFQDKDHTTPESIHWDEPNDWFEFSNDVKVSGMISATTVDADQSIRINIDQTPMSDAVIYFSTETLLNRSFRFTNDNDANPNRFEMTDDLYVDGGLEINGSILGVDSLDLDSGLYISDDITITGTVDGVDVSDLNDAIAADSVSWNIAATLGATISSGEILNATIKLEDLSDMDAAPGHVLVYGGAAWDTETPSADILAELIGTSRDTLYWDVPGGDTAFMFIIDYANDTTWLEPVVGYTFVIGTDGTIARFDSIMVAGSRFPVDSGTVGYQLTTDADGTYYWAAAGGAGSAIEDVAYGAAWNGDLDGASKNVIYDYLHLFDTDDDGDIGDETITLSGNWVNTANPWADNEIATSTNWNTAYTHSQDNTQAHTDYLLNGASDVMIGTLTADGLTLGADENITLGSQTLDHDGTDFVFNDAVRSSTDLYADGDIHINKDSTDADAILYFTDADEQQTIKWLGGADDKFEISDDLDIIGDLAISGAHYIDGNAYINYDETDVDVFLYFTGTTEYIAWDRDDGRFVWSDDAYMAGNLEITLDAIIGGGGLTLRGNGVKISGSADGDITFLGLGDGFDEDININLDDTENTAVISSTTGLTLFDFGVIDIDANGFIIGSADIDESELEIIDGATLSTTELNYVKDVTSAIQTQLNAKEGTLTNEAGLYSALGDVTDFLQLSDMDASSELLAIMDDETGSAVGSPLLVFNQAPVFNYKIIADSLLIDSIGVQELDVGGSITVGGAVVGGTGTTSDLSLKTTSGVGATGADMHFLVGNDGATEAMTILNNGNVGIGAISPSATLEVKGPNAGSVGGFPAGAFQVTAEGTSQYIPAVITGHNSYNGNTQLWYLGSLSSSNDDISFINRQDADLFLSTNNTERMCIKNDGEVQVVGNIATGDTTAGDVDVFHYFSTNGSWTSEYLKWDDGIGEFQLTDDIDITGNITVSGTVDGVDISAIPATYEVQLDDEAGLYAVLNNVSNFVQDAEVPGLETDAAHDDFSELGGTVADGQIADGAVDGGAGGEIEDGTISVEDLGSNSVDSDELVNGSIDLSHLSATAVDSNKIANGDLSIDDINWRAEWYYLTEVYGRPRALDDSITLLDNIFDSSWNTYLLWDIAGNYTGTSNDTFMVKGHNFPEDGVMDSLQIFYRVSTDADILSISFQGPNVGDFNHTDSTYWTNSVNLSSYTWDTAHYDFSTEGSDVTINNGATFGLGLITQFSDPSGDDDTLMIEWIRVRVTR